CNRKTNASILKNGRKSLSGRRSGGFWQAIARVCRLQACQQSSENCKRGRLCSSPSMPGRVLRAFLTFLALAIVWTWPLALHLSTRIPHDPGDPILNIWLLWWNAHAIPFSERWWNPPVFFPMRGALALSEHLAGIGLIATPLQWLHTNALAAYNIAFILSFALSG